MPLIAKEILKIATDRARVVLKPGDIIQARMCGGRQRRFTFTHWDKDWICGKNVSDCAAASINKVNGAPADFLHGIGRPWLLSAIDHEELEDYRLWLKKNDRCGKGNQRFEVENLKATIESCYLWNKKDVAHLISKLKVMVNAFPNDINYVTSRCFFLRAAQRIYWARF